MDNVPRQIVPPDNESAERLESHASPVRRTNDEKHRQCVSLPVFCDQVNTDFHFPKYFGLLISNYCR